MYKTEYTSRPVIIDQYLILKLIFFQFFCYNLQKFGNRGIRKASYWRRSLLPYLNWLLLFTMLHFLPIMFLNFAQWLTHTPQNHGSSAWLVEVSWSEKLVALHNSEGWKGEKEQSPTKSKYKLKPFKQLKNYKGLSWLLLGDMMI